MEETPGLRLVMMVVASAALVQFIVLAILVVDDIWMEVIMSMAVGHSVMIVIIVMVVGFPSMTALFKFVDDLERVLMLVILFVEVMVMVLMMWHVTMGHELVRVMPVSRSMVCDVSAKDRMRMSEGALFERTAS